MRPKHMFCIGILQFLIGRSHEYHRVLFGLPHNNHIFGWWLTRKVHEANVDISNDVESSSRWIWALEAWAC